MGEKIRKIGKILTGVVLFTFIGKILGFFIELILSYYFGATGISDAYLISQTIPGTIFQFVGTGLTTCFVPIYFKILKDKGKEKVDEFTNKILSLVLLFSTVVIILVFVDTQSLIKLFASGFEGETLKYAIIFTRIGILGLYFSTLIYVYNSYLQANEIFIPTAFSAIPNSIFIMISIIVGAKYNIYFLSIGSTLAVMVQLLFLILPIQKLKFKLKPNFNFKDIYIKEFFLLMVPVIIGVSVNEINILIDRTIASQLAVGGISALTYANSLIMFVQGGLIQPISTICYPKITQAISKGNKDEAKIFIKETITLALTVLIPLTVGFIVFGVPIIQLLFGRGAFDENAVIITSNAVKFYAVGLCFVGLRELLSRYYYAYSNTKTPMINAAIGVIMNIVMNILFSKILGIGGLAFSTSLSAFITTVLLLRDCKNKLPGGNLELDIMEIAKVIVCSAIMGIVSFGIYNILPFSTIINLFLAALLAIIIFLIFSIIFKLNYINIVKIFVNRNEKIVKI